MHSTPGQDEMIAVKCLAILSALGSIFSFLYIGLSAVYYGFMPQTSDILRSLALVLIAPGNILRETAMFRRSFCSLKNCRGYRAYFDYPVLVWLENCISKTELEHIAINYGLKMELDGLEIHKKDAFLAFSEEMQIKSNELTALLQGKNKTLYDKGPFESGIGMYCASLENWDASAYKQSVIKAPKLRSKTAILAMAELDWVKSGSFSSAWNIIAAKRIKTAPKNHINNL